MTKIVDAGIKLHAEMYHPFMKKIGWGSNDIDIFVHHQVGHKVFKSIVGYSGIDASRMSSTLGKFGNLTSATIPFNLNQLLEKSELKPGKKVFISNAGGGLSASNSAFIWD